MNDDARFEPVESMEDLMSLDADEIIAGYYEGFNGEPEPGHNRGRAYWHGWRNGACDGGHIEGDSAMRRLAAEYISAQRPQ